MSGNDSYRCPGYELCGAALTASSAHPTAPDTTGGELRDVLIAALAGLPRAEWDGIREAERLRIVHGVAADRVIDGPLRDLLAERDTLAAQVRAVEGLAATWTRYPQSAEDRERNRYGAAMQDCGESLRRALGTPTTGGGE